MKPQSIPTHARNRPLGPAGLSLLVLLAITCAASGQSADNFDVSAVSDEPETEAGTQPGAGEAEKPKKAPGPVSLTPSRYVTPEDLDAFVASTGESLVITDKETDPFGQYQDPDAKPVIRKATTTPKRATPVYKATPFADIVSLIRVSTVMPGENKFLIGDREIHLGERIPVSFRGKDMSLEVVEVTSSEIRFRNIENGDTAPLKLNLLPPGMTPGIGELMTAPGMVPKDSSAPIHLEGNLPDSESSLNP